ncbi:HWE histidine kinase domain-containing protein [Caulobacter sp. KR2-114]|uniref:HWE histidine kinase domain-containing protein n=1 Tax=Caulobacter sp. KR2-114 TaxID=3400912 RepID=UPI003C0E0EE6
MAKEAADHPAAGDAPSQGASQDTRSRAARALAAANMGEFEYDRRTGHVTISSRMAAITGLAEGVTEDGRDLIFSLIHADDRERVREQIAAGLAQDGRYEVRYRMVRPDNGRVLWMYSAAAFDPPDDPEATLIGVVQDLSERRVDDELRATMVAELDHRVKNVLASVQSMALQSARKTTSLDAFLKTFAGRLEAMASAHTLLTATRWRGAEIVNIAAAELGGLAPGQAHWRGPEIVLNPRATNALTLALHELATNAVKYGALSVETGRVDVTWRAMSDGGFELIWQERGGPPVIVPQKRGFGCTLLERVTGRELGGSAVLEFRPAGVRALLRADASALAATPKLPATAAPAAIEAERPAEPRQASTGGGGPDDIRGVKVLVVEDAVLLAIELESGLTEAGAEVVGVAATLDEAQAMLALQFDVAVLDANLNGESVTPVAAALAARGQPFIFATGYRDADITTEAFDAPVVRKPYNVHQIAAALLQAMGQARAAG